VSGQQFFSAGMVSPEKTLLAESPYSAAVPIGLEQLYIQLDIRLQYI
jgi:hypothetical protein